MIKKILTGVKNTLRLSAVRRSWLDENVINFYKHKRPIAVGYSPTFGYAVCRDFYDIEYFFSNIGIADGEVIMIGDGKILKCVADMKDYQANFA